MISALGGVHIWSSAHNFKLSVRTGASSSITRQRLCHRHPSSSPLLPGCWNRRASTYILRTFSSFKGDSSNCGLWGGRPRAANVILIRLPQEGDRRRHAVVCLRILSALLLFSTQSRAFVTVTGSVHCLVRARRKTHGGSRKAARLLMHYVNIGHAMNVPHIKLCLSSGRKQKWCIYVLIKEEDILM